MERFAHLTARNGRFGPVFSHTYGTFEATGSCTRNVTGNTVYLRVIIRFNDYPVVFSQPAESSIHLSHEFGAADSRP
jgi:hypothetical protein